MADELDTLDQFLTSKLPDASPQEKVQAIDLGGQVNQIQAAGTKNAQAMALLEKANSGVELNRGEWLAMLAATVIPAIAGAALGGKKGALAGVEAGAKGSLTGLKQLQEQDKETNLAQAKILLDQQAQEDQVAAQLAKEQRGADEFDRRLGAQAEKEFNVAARKDAAGLGGKGININLDRGQAKVDTVEKISSARTAVESVDDITRNIDAVAEKYGGLAKMDDKSLAAQLGDVAGRKVSEFAPGSPERELAADLQFLVAEQGSELMKGTLSDRDLSRLETAITGGKLSSLPLVHKLVSKQRDKILRKTFNFVKDANKVVDLDNFPASDFVSIEKFRSAQDQSRRESSDLPEDDVESLEDLLGMKGLE